MPSSNGNARHLRRPIKLTPAYFYARRSHCPVELVQISIDSILSALSPEGRECRLDWPYSNMCAIQCAALKMEVVAGEDVPQDFDSCGYSRNIVRSALLSNLLASETGLCSAAHLAWVASSVAKCLQMVPSDQVQLDFFATSEKVLPMNTAYDDAKLELPRPHYGAGHVRRDSEDSNSAWDDDMSDTKTETVYSQHYQSAKRSPPSSDPTDDLYDIYFEGEDEEGDSYAEQQLSTAVQQEVRASSFEPK